MLTQWLYETARNNKVRYVLGIRGKKPLVCFGINPSTASPQSLDNTLKSVKRFALANGYDAWLMFNIYPLRSTKPDNLPAKFDEVLHNENLKFIAEYLPKNADVWAAWGAVIEKRDYLKYCLSDIYRVVSKKNANWLRLGALTKAGHPHHPLYLSKDTKFEPFDAGAYLAQLNQKVR